ncbi:hypothetical protein OC834_004329 [Tilletia horrida]|uniref:DNA replication factor Cdt1 C-terminal domain-containing protein n=1 Tax=Tilletia horrida TaxID=155126 RepID=A0AAN6GBI5_9BASI|nr:hypothetical protein OC834_004329 [Tilletia horrida]KAK0529542.1 hypothetical protein OC842_004206 [Tilletia horrida]
MDRPSTPPPQSASKKRRTAVAAGMLAGVDPSIDSHELLGSPSRSSPRAFTSSGTKRKRTTSSSSSTSPSTSSAHAPDLSILSPAAKRAVALASPSSRSPSRMGPASMLAATTMPGSPTPSISISTPASSARRSVASSCQGGAVRSSGGSSNSMSSTTSSSARSSWDLLSELSTPATSVASSSPISSSQDSLTRLAGKAAVSSCQLGLPFPSATISAPSSSFSTTGLTPKSNARIAAAAIAPSINSSGGSTRSSTSISSTSTAGRALSLRERIQAKEQARLQELEGMTRRHGALFARAAGRSIPAGLERKTAAAVGLGISDPDADALAGPPALPSPSQPSSKRGTKRPRDSSKAATAGQYQAPALSATRRQTAALMDVLKRKSLVSRLPEIADSLYMLFTHAAAAQGMSMPSSSASGSSSSGTAADKDGSRSAAGGEGAASAAIPAITATPRVPVLPLSEVLTSLTRSSRTILSRVELREALGLLIEFVPGFLEIRKVGQGGAEWATLGFGRGAVSAAGSSSGAGHGAGHPQPLGLKEVRERLKALV